MKLLKFIQTSVLFQIALLMVLVAILVAPMPKVGALKYGVGGYGNCTFNTCGITLSLASAGTIPIALTPSGTGSCSVKKESATIITGSDTGFSLLLQDTDTVSSLNELGGQSIPAVTGTQATPVSLGVNTWGYRVDGVGGFGVGPTAEVTNGATPTLPFAAIPLSNQTASTIAQTSVETGTAGVVTNTFLGVCVDSTKPAASYTNQVTFTAIVN